MRSRKVLSRGTAPIREKFSGTFSLAPRGFKKMEMGFSFPLIVFGTATNSSYGTSRIVVSIMMPSDVL